MSEQKCSDEKCIGKINIGETVYVVGGCGMIPRIPSHPCNICGMLHREDNTPLENSCSQKTFLKKDGTVVVRGESGTETDITQFTA